MLQSDLFGTGSNEDSSNTLSQLDDEEIETLKRAGIIDKSRKLQLKKNPKKHIVFVADEDEGMYFASIRQEWYLIF